MAKIELERLTKVYADGTEAVKGIDLEVEDGELVVLVGPSGCGKTTVLRMIAGLEDITSGVVRIASEVVNDLSAKDRDIAMVFQNYALYPHMTSYDNIAFGLKIRGISKGEIDRRVRSAARMLGLADALERKPRTLSGGQRQRVAMGRAIVREPLAFLMDEPLSNLDAKLRVQMRAEIARIQREIGATTIYVTHDQSEAMTLGDRVCVLRDGILQQVDSPQALYHRPASLFVAEFIGSPAMNLIEADLEHSNGSLRVRFGAVELPVSGTLAEARPRLRAYEGRKVALGVRPEDIEDAAAASGRPVEQRLSARVDIREDMGSEVFLHFSVAGRQVRSKQVEDAIGEEESEALALRGEDRGVRFVARVDRTTRAAEGKQVELVVDTSRLYFFDLDTGHSIYD